MRPSLPRLFTCSFLVLMVYSFLSSCKKDSNTPSNPDLATVSTDRVEAITWYSATVVSTVSKEGKSAVTGMGIAYGKNPNPTVVADKNIPYAGFSVGTFSTVLDDLETGTTYYVRAYATNSSGTSYGNQQTFNTVARSIFNSNLTYGTMSDNDGNTYKTIVIGTQTWMAENLKTTKYRNGDPITTNLSDSAWLVSTGGAYAVYDNNPQNNSIYGKLYNWYAVVDSRNLCPTGWHVPSDAEWTTLVNFLGGSGVAGGKLKSTSSLWTAPNTGATNESGFSGLPGGGRGNYGAYVIIGNNGDWWSSTELNSNNNNAWGRSLFSGGGGSGRYYGGKRTGFSVRCLRD